MMYRSLLKYSDSYW